MMANPRRGELKIKLGDKTFEGRVTLDVVQRIENGMNMGVIQIAQCLSDGSLKTTDMTNILTPVIRAGGNDVNEKDVGQALWGAGLADGMKAIGEIIALVLGSGGDEGNEEEVAQAL